MVIVVQYTIPISYTQEDELLSYLDNYSGPFISYILTSGKAHIDAIDFNQ